MPTERKSPAGRSPIINDELVKRIESALMNGMSQEGVCNLVGISSDTYYKWLRISEGLQADGEHAEMPKKPRRLKGDSDKTYEARLREYDHQIDLLSGFSGRVKNALASVELLMLNAIIEAANPSPPAKGEDPKPPNWTAAAWYLERVLWRTYGRRTIGNDDDGNINVNIRVTKTRKDDNNS